MLQVQAAARLDCGDIPANVDALLAMAREVGDARAIAKSTALADGAGRHGADGRRELCRGLGDGANAAGSGDGGVQGHRPRAAAAFGELDAAMTGHEEALKTSRRLGDASGRAAIFLAMLGLHHLRREEDDFTLHRLPGSASAGKRV